VGCKAESNAEQPAKATNTTLSSLDKPTTLLNSSEAKPNKQATLKAITKNPIMRNFNGMQKQQQPIRKSAAKNLNPKSRQGRQILKKIPGII